MHNAVQGQGLGGELLVDAFARIDQLSTHIGCIGVMIDAKNEAASRFYVRYGFSVIDATSWPHRLFLPLQTMKSALGY